MEVTYCSTAGIGNDLHISANVQRRLMRWGFPMRSTPEQARETATQQSSDPGDASVPDTTEGCPCPTRAERKERPETIQQQQSCHTAAAGNDPPPITSRRNRASSTIAHGNGANQRSCNGLKHGGGVGSTPKTPQPAKRPRRTKEPTPSHGEGLVNDPQGGTHHGGGDETLGDGGERVGSDPEAPDPPPVAAPQKCPRSPSSDKSSSPAHSYTGQ